MTTEEKRLIGNLMARHKRAWHSPPARRFIPDSAAATMTTREYVRRWLSANGLIDLGHSAAAPATRPAREAA